MPQRCPACGATNPDSAQWCGQCYHRFDAPSDDRAQDATLPRPSARPRGEGERADTTREATDTPSGFRRRGDAIEWACPQCEHFNDIELVACEVCGTEFVERFRRHEPEVDHDWQRAVRLNAIAPGMGHVSLGRRGSGVARLVIVALWLAGTLTLVVSGGPRAFVVALPLLVGAAVVWIGSVVDVLRLQRGQPEVLMGRRLVWVVVAVLGLMVVSLLASVATLAS